MKLEVSEKEVQNILIHSDQVNIKIITYIPVCVCDGHVHIYTSTNCNPTTTNEPFKHVDNGIFRVHFCNCVKTDYTTSYINTVLRFTVVKPALANY